jgi:hypothetical protein
MNKHLETDLAYAAGIFDGEGCVCIKEVKQHKSHKPTYSLSVHITNTNEDVINWLLINFDGSKHTKIPKQENRRKYFRWNCQSKHAANFLTEILPYIKIKNPQVEIALSFQARRFPLQGGWKKTPLKQILDEADKVLMSKQNHGVAA